MSFFISQFCNEVTGILREKKKCCT
jgi:hypothetical protein